MPVFVCHDQGDEAVYTAICALFDRSGIDRWDPRSMAPGVSLEGQLRLAIESCDACVFVATGRSVKSSWCLSELGAFWGRGKTIIAFMADSSLNPADLPPQTQGKVRVHNAYDLISHFSHRKAEIEFIDTSGNYGLSKDWARLIDEAEFNLDILGMTLLQWRRHLGFSQELAKTARKGCRIRILFIDEKAPVLDYLLYSDNVSPDSVKSDARESYRYYQSLSLTADNIEVRTIKRGKPHFFLTRNDKRAVLHQYFLSLAWGSGPLMACCAESTLYEMARGEFEYLWENAT